MFILEYFDVSYAVNIACADNPLKISPLFRFSLHYFKLKFCERTKMNYYVLKIINKNSSMCNEDEQTFMLEKLCFLIENSKPKQYKYYTSSRY